MKTDWRLLQKQIVLTLLPGPTTPRAAKRTVVSFYPTATSISILPDSHACISNGCLHFVYVRFEQTNNLLFHSCTYYWYGPFRFIQYLATYESIRISFYPLVASLKAIVGVSIARSFWISNAFGVVLRRPMGSQRNHFERDEGSVSRRDIEILSLYIAQGVPLLCNGKNK